MILLACEAATLLDEMRAGALMPGAIGYRRVDTMGSAVGKKLDLAEGGTPAALRRIADLGLMQEDRLVCVLTGALYPGLA